MISAFGIDFTSARVKQSHHRRIDFGLIAERHFTALNWHARPDYYRQCLRVIVENANASRLNTAYYIRNARLRSMILMLMPSMSQDGFELLLMLLLTESFDA